MRRRARCIRERRHEEQRARRLTLGGSRAARSSRPSRDDASLCGGQASAARGRPRRPRRAAWPQGTPGEAPAVEPALAVDDAPALRDDCVVVLVLERQRRNSRPVHCVSGLCPPPTRWSPACSKSKGQRRSSPRRGFSPRPPFPGAPLSRNGAGGNTPPPTATARCARDAAGPLGGFRAGPHAGPGCARALCKKSEDRTRGGRLPRPPPLGAPRRPRA